jgi:hypothetical protein
VNEKKFLNQFQPQTLVIATLLLYIDAFFNLISFNALLVLIAILGAAGGYGIANEKRWGYIAGTTFAVIQVVLLFGFYGGQALDFPLILTLLFDGALVALLVHPQSREYERIWFK